VAIYGQRARQLQVQVDPTEACGPSTLTLTQLIGGPRARAVGLADGRVEASTPGTAASFESANQEPLRPATSPRIDAAAAGRRAGQDPAKLEARAVRGRTCRGKQTADRRLRSRNGQQAVHGHEKVPGATTLKGPGTSQARWGRLPGPDGITIDNRVPHGQA